MKTQRFHSSKNDDMTIQFEDGFQTDIFGRIDASPEIATIYVDERQSEHLWKLREAHGDFIWCQYGNSYIDLDKNLYIHVQPKWWQLWKK